MNKAQDAKFTLAYIIGLEPFVITVPEEFDDVLKKAGKSLVIIDFYADWCGPCRMISPKFEAMSEEAENKDVLFCKVNVDENQDTSESCQISAMPTFQAYKDSKKVGELVGASEEKLRSLIASNR